MREECIIIRGEMNSEIYITHAKLYIYIYTLYIYIYDIIVNAGKKFFYEKVLKVYIRSSTTMSAYIDYNNLRFLLWK